MRSAQNECAQAELPGRRLSNREGIRVAPPPRVISGHTQGSLDIYRKEEQTTWGAVAGYVRRDAKARAIREGFLGVDGPEDGGTRDQQDWKQVSLSCSRTCFSPLPEQRHPFARAVWSRDG